MAIRMTGMVSGLDTEAIIESLVEAQKSKNKKKTDEKTKIEWKQEIWKELNTKLYKFTTGTVSKMRLQSTYGTKKATCSDTSKVTVTGNASAPLGSQELKIKQLAKSGYLTGAQIKTKDQGAVTTSTTVKEMGITDGSTISIKLGDKTKDVTLKEDMKISDVLTQLKEVGVNASFDATQKRFYISSKKSGEENDFSLVASDADGRNALQKLGLATKDLSAAEEAEYKKWAAATGTNGNNSDDNIFDYITKNSELNASYEAKITSLTESYKEQIKSKEDEITTFNDEKASLQTELDELNKINYNNTDTWNGFVAENTTKMFTWKADYEALTETEKANLKDDNGNIVEVKTVEDYYKYRANKELAADKKAKQAEIDAKQKDIDDKTAEISKIKTTKLNDTDGNDGVKEEAKAFVIAKAKNAQDILTNGTGYTGPYATKIDGQDAEFTLNDVEYKSNTNETTINGVSLTFTGTTAPDETISFTVTNDIDSVYNTVKDFVKEYNEILDELNKLYSADSAKGYDPLTDEEKDAMSEDEVEKWEKKIKDSLLRRDDTVSGITSTMRNSLLTNYEYNGKKYSLSSFGIVTSSDYTEKGKLHIKGDADDDTYSAETNKLKAALEEDPDAVMNVLSGIFENLYSGLQDKMKKTSMSSALTFYNDTYMKNQLVTLNKQIKNDETKLPKLEDKYYKQFTAMEVAMQKMQQQQSYLSSFLGM